jgi:hypothetical protein
MNAELLHLFFRCNFDIQLMLRKNGNQMRRHSINDYLNSGNHVLLSEHIDDMIFFYNNHRSANDAVFILNTHPDFPSKMIIKFMKPYLKLYLTYIYSLVEMESKDAEIQLFQKLKELNSLNITFGQIPTTDSNKTIGSTGIPTDNPYIANLFNTKETISQFLQSHHI